MYFVILSALIYLLSFIYPKYLFVGIFLWIVPLAIQGSENKYSYKKGYIWGLVFFSLHLSWFWFTLYNKGYGNGRMFVYFIVVLYLSSLSGFWFLLYTYIYRLLRKFIFLKRNKVARDCAWVISTVTFLYISCYCSFAMFDCFDGYPFINPLLPLVSWIWYLRALPYIGLLSYWIMIILVNLAIVHLLEEPNVLAWLLLFGLLFFWIFLPLSNLKKTFPYDSDMIAYIKPTWNKGYLHEQEQFYAIARKLNELALKDSKIKIVVIPEAGFSHNLLAWNSQLSAWTDLFDDVHIFIGAHRCEGQSTYNSLYHIYNGEICGWYDKTHLVPFVERIPFLCRFINVFDTLFAHNYFSYPMSNQLDVEFLGFKPYICSEIFLKKNRSIESRPILFICNDSWLSLDYACNLAQRLAILYALSSDCAMIYVSSYCMKIF